MNYKIVSETWVCLTCPDRPSFQRTEAMDHLRQVHKIEPKTTQATKTGIEFLDFASGASNIFEFDIPGVAKLTRTRVLEKVK